MQQEQFSRTERMIGSEGLRRLQGSHVVVVGLGAVGSYAVEALTRAGVGHLRLVDFDEIRPSNLNRQLFALHSTVGQPKIDVALRRVRDINPACQVEGLRCFAHTETMDQILAGPPAVVIDAIDSLTPKTELLAALVTRGLPVVSSMGAALRSDPTAVRVGPLSEVHHCRLAFRVRRRLRRRGIGTEFLCVYSTEPQGAPPASARDHATPNDSNFLARGRTRRPLGSLPTLTGIFGLTTANTALRMLLGKM